MPSPEDALITMRQVLLPDENSGDDGDHPWETIRAHAAERGLVHQDNIEDLPFTFALDQAFLHEEA